MKGLGIIQVIPYNNESQRCHDNSLDLYLLLVVNYALIPKILSIYSNTKQQVGSHVSFMAWIHGMLP